TESHRARRTRWKDCRCRCDQCRAKPLSPCGSCNVSLLWCLPNSLEFHFKLSTHRDDGRHTDCFNAAVSTGGFRSRLPVAAKIALVTAGTIAEVPASPIPPGGSVLFTM